MKHQYQDVLDFWLNLSPKDYFAQSDELDAQITAQFKDIVDSAVSGALFDEWSRQPDSCAALVILIDQMTRNIYRGSIDAYFGDIQAQVLSRLAIQEGYLDSVDPGLVQWLLMPLMHSENVEDQKLSLELFKKYELTGSLDFAQEHKEIIEQFGRFPHRNMLYNRSSTPEEIAYMNDGGFQG